MMMDADIDIDHLRTWIGREEIAEDDLTVSLSQRFHATLGSQGEFAGHGETAPRLIHFCLCQPAALMNELGPDGHPARGDFLPPVTLPRRMWASGDIRFFGDLRVGDHVQRHSVIEDVRLKHGKSGPLCFVTVRHRFSVGHRDVVDETQTLVYRSAAAPTQIVSPIAAAPQGHVVVMVTPKPTLLFRYSALTFNGHRIHYDHSYAVQSEGYAGLVVHGPLQATMLLQLAVRENGGRSPDRFTFRSMSTLFDKEPMFLHAGPLQDGQMGLWTSAASGPVATQAQASWV